MNNASNMEQIRGISSHSSSKPDLILDDAAGKIISDIARRGNEAEIRLKDGGYIILEVMKKIRYRA